VPVVAVRLTFGCAGGTAPVHAAVAVRHRPR
jgi:hypothetical protein